MGHADILDARLIGSATRYQAELDANHSAFENYVADRADDELHNSAAVVDAMSMYDVDPASALIDFAGRRMSMLEALIEYAPPSLRGAVLNSVADSNGFRAACESTYESGPAIEQDARIAAVLSQARQWSQTLNDTQNRAYARGMLVGRMQARSDLPQQRIDSVIAKINATFGA